MEQQSPLAGRHRRLAFEPQRNLHLVGGTTTWCLHRGLPLPASFTPIKTCKRQSSMACMPGTTSGRVVTRSATSQPQRVSWALAISTLALLPALAGCQRAAPANKFGPDTNAAPPTVVCGTVLTEAAAGAVLYDVSGRSRIAVRHASAEGLFYIRFATDCRRGYHIRVQPTAAAVIARKALAHDGQPVAVAIRARSGRFLVIGERDGRTVTVAVGSPR